MACSPRLQLYLYDEEIPRSCPLLPGVLLEATNGIIYMVGQSNGEALRVIVSINVVVMTNLHLARRAENHEMWKIPNMSIMQTPYSLLQCLRNLFYLFILVECVLDIKLYRYCLYY